MNLTDVAPQPAAPVEEPAHIPGRRYGGADCEKCGRQTAHYRDKGGPETCVDCKTVRRHASDRAKDVQAAPTRTPTEATKQEPTEPAPYVPERTGVHMRRAERVEVSRRLLDGLHKMVEAASWLDEESTQRILADLAALAPKCITSPFASMPIELLPLSAEDEIEAARAIAKHSSLSSSLPSFASMPIELPPGVTPEGVEKAREDLAQATVIHAE